MKSAALGLAFPLWLRLRWPALVALAYLVVVAAVAPALRPAAAQGAPPASPAAVFSSALMQTPLPALLLAIPLLFAMACLLAASTYGSADLTSRQAGFPSHMLVLPLSTRALVGWPMLFGAGGVGLAWLLLAHLVLLPAGAPVRVLWPAALVCALTAWVQAIDWWPFRAPPGRAICTTLAILALGAFAAWGTSAGFSTPLMTASYGAAAAVACLVALAGVSRARQGRHQNDSARLLRRFAGLPGRSAATGPAAVKPFRSASAAQFWYERRRNALLFPAVCAACFGPMLLPLAAMTRPARVPLVFRGVEVSPVTAVLLVCAAAPVFMAAGLSAVLGKSDAFSKDIRFSPFLATQPLSTGRFVTAKLRAAAYGTALAWLALISILLTGGAVGALRSPGPAPVFAPLRAHASPAGLGSLLAGLFLLSLMTWRNQVIGLFITLSGRPWISRALAVAFGIVSLLAASGGLLLYSHPGAWPHLPPVTHWALGALIAVKGVAAAVLSILLLRRRLVRRRDLAMGFLLWAAVVVSSGLAACRFVAMTPMLAGWVVLLAPFTRVALAPLALDANRHR